MKVSLSRPQSKKIKSTMTSKKNSHTNSLIYKQITSQMEQLFSKSKFINQNLNKDNKQPKQNKNLKDINKSVTEQQKSMFGKKGSYINMKKKLIKNNVNISTIEQGEKIVNKLTNNFMAGTNSPVSQNSDNQQKIEFNLQHLKKSIDMKSIHSKGPTISNAVSPSMLKSTSSTQPRKSDNNQNKSSINVNNQLISNLNSSSNVLSKKSYTKTKIKLQAKLFNNYKLQRKLFCYDYIIGKGGFGKVWKVQHIKTRNLYAMKEMLKSIVMTKKSVQSVMNQRVLLSQLNSPFLVNMHYAFQDRDTLYLVLDLMEGGDLRYHIGNKVFNEIQAKFFIACIILGLQHMHRHNMIHRDIKPQNLVLDSRGYIRITDLGIARTFRQNNSCDTSGTPGYMSPQVICRQNHGFVSDFFAVGVIAYQLMTGKRPYNGKSRNQIRDCMLAKQAQVKPGELPQDWSYQAADFINRLIQRKPQNRLGFGGIQQIKNHPWIKTLNWQKLYTKQIQSPFIPMMKKKNFDQDQQITIEDQQQAQMIQKNSLLLRKPQFQELFKQYYYDENQNIQTAKQSTAFSKKNSIGQKNQRNSNQNKQVTEKQKKESAYEKGKKYSQQIYIKRTVNNHQKNQHKEGSTGTATMRQSKQHIPLNIGSSINSYHHNNNLKPQQEQDFIDTVVLKQAKKQTQSKPLTSDITKRKSSGIGHIYQKNIGEKQKTFFKDNKR